MALWQEGFESGVNSLTIDTGNTGFTQIDVLGSPTGQFASNLKAHGALSMYVSGPSGSQFRCRRMGFSSPSLAARFYIYLQAKPNVSGAAITEIRDTGGAIVGTLSLDLNGTLLFSPKTGAAFTLGVLTLTTWYRVELEVTRGTSTTTGQIALRVYALDNTTPTVYSITSSTIDLGTLDLAQFNIGKCSTTPTWSMYLDDVAVNDGSTAPIGIATTNVKPTANAGAAQYVQAASVVSVVGTDSDPDGTVASRAWTVLSSPGAAPTLTGASTATVSFTAATPGRYTLRYIVTDNLGLPSDPSDVIIYVYPASGADVTVYSDTIGTWTKIGAAATSAAGLVDTDDTTGVQSPINPTSQPYLAVLNPVGPGNITLKLRGRYVDAAVTRTVTVYKVDGTTQIYQTTQAPPAALADQIVTLDAAALAAIPATSDRRALVVKVASAV